MGFFDFLGGSSSPQTNTDTQMQPASFTPDNDPLWTNFLANVFGEKATNMGTFPEPEQPQQHSLQFGIGTTPGSQSSGTAMSGAGGSAGGMQMQKSSVAPVQTEPLTITPSALSSEVAQQQQPTEPNVFQPLQQYMKNLVPQGPEADPNTNVKVINGQVIIKMGEQWVPITQIMQSPNGGGTQGG